MRVLKTLVWASSVLVLAAGGYAYVFDAVDVSSKARGMGGAWTASADDPTAVFYNPACLVGEAEEIGATYFRPNSQDFESMALVAYSRPIGSSQNLAVSYRKFGVEYKGVDLVDESTVAVAHALELMKDLHSSLAVGYCLSLYRLEFGPTARADLGGQTTYGVDLGFIGVLRDRTRIGIFLKNVNEPSVGEVHKEALPQWVSAGVSYVPYYGVTTELDIRNVRGEDVEMHMGMEFEVSRLLALRFGFQTEPHSLAGGFTVKIRPVEIDYAYSSHSVLPGTHHVSVRARGGGGSR